MDPGRYDIQMREDEPLSLALTLYDPRTGDGDYPLKNLADADFRGQVRYAESHGADLAEDAAFTFGGVAAANLGYVLVGLPASHGLAAGVYWYELEIDEGRTGTFESFLAGRVVVNRGTSP